MTENKPIMIDGIDVSGCIFYGETMHPTKNCTMDSEYLHSCNGCKCYFKQLTRKTQECEELKNEIEACYNQVEDFDIIATSKSNKLKQAEQKLKRIREICNYAYDEVDKENDACFHILQIINEVE